MMTTLLPRPILPESSRSLHDGTYGASVERCARLRRAIGVVVFLLGGCAGSHRAREVPPDAAPVDSMDIAGGAEDAGVAPFVNPQDPECSAAAKLIYVVDENGMFSSFDPTALTFTDIGQLDCPASMGASPNSMAVDRSATAWVNYQSGEIFKVDPKVVTGGKVSCEATSFKVNQMAFYIFGMGFAADAPSSTSETLYIGSLTGSGALGKISFPDLAVSRVGPLGGWAELTGTGDAELWGFFPDATAPKVAQIDKATGQLVPSKTYAAASIQGSALAWAFAFWGDAFWIFLDRFSDGSTNVYRVNRADGAITMVIENTGREIAGAGVSTCAPFTGTAKN